MFEHVDTFKRLEESLINSKNDVHQEIQQRIDDANWAFFSQSQVDLNQNFSLEDWKYDCT